MFFDEGSIQVFLRIRPSGLAGPPPPTTHHVDPSSSSSLLPATAAATTAAVQPLSSSAPSALAALTSSSSSAAAALSEPLQEAPTSATDAPLRAAPADTPSTAPTGPTTQSATSDSSSHKRVEDFTIRRFRNQTTVSFTRVVERPEEPSPAAAGGGGAPARLAAAGATAAPPRRPSMMLYSDLATQRVVDNSIQQYHFPFRNVFTEEATQQEVFEAVARPAVLSALDGFNATVFAYGQTGSGKTFSTTGPPAGAGSLHQEGYLPRSLSFLFDEILARQGELGLQYAVRVSYLQIYNDVGQDLLNDGRGCSHMEALPVVRVSLTSHSKAPMFENLQLKRVSNAAEALRCLALGQSNRRTCETPLNKSSSRSHCVFTVWIESRVSFTSGSNTTTTTTDDGGSQNVPWSITKLHFVDLAGSERLNRPSNNNGGNDAPFRLHNPNVFVSHTTHTESRNINLSLHYLEQVIVALGTAPSRRGRGGEETFIPFRNSTLTMALRDALGGDSYTAMLATVHPHKEMRQETISTCQFAMRVSRVRQALSKADSADPEEIIRKLRNENQELRNKLRDTAPQPLHTVHFSTSQVTTCQKVVAALLNQTTMPTLGTASASRKKRPTRSDPSVDFAFAKELHGNFALAVGSLCIMKRRFASLHKMLQKQRLMRDGKSSSSTATKSSSSKKKATKGDEDEDVDSDAEEEEEDENGDAAPTTAADEEAAPPRSPTPPPEECHLCCLELEDVSSAFVCCEGHRMCRECFSQYVLVTWADKVPLLIDEALRPAEEEEEGSSAAAAAAPPLRPRRRLPEVGCPFPGCTQPPLRDSVVGYYANEDAFEKYLEVRQSARDAQMVAETHARFASIVTAEQQRQLDTQFLREQLVRVFPNALMCPQCLCGPIVIQGCDDLAAHHGQEMSGGVTIQNRCPNCGFFALRRSEWLVWDGSAPLTAQTTTAEERLELEEAREYEEARMELERLRLQKQR